MLKWNTEVICRTRWIAPWERPSSSNQIYYTSKLSFKRVDLSNYEHL